MNSDFEYRKTDNGVCVTKILTPRAVVMIPEALDGLPVAELDGHLFADSPLEEVFLPKTLMKIGRYAFYNCESLQAVHFYYTTREIGGGLFNGCGRISDLYVCLGRDERSALRDFVTEVNRRLTVHCLFEEDGKDREAARLIFPLYYDEAVENTPARIISNSVHGSGQKYRYCFENMKINYERYDRVFEYEVIEEGVLQAAELAVCRLMYPHELNQAAGRMYLEFLMENRQKILLGNMERPDIFKWILKMSEGGGDVGGHGRQTARKAAAGLNREFRYPGLSEKELDCLTDAAGKEKKPEILAALMDLRHRKFQARKRTFDF